MSATGTRVVALGTAGGPLWRTHIAEPARTGIATAIAVGETWYLVDVGSGVGPQMVRSGLDITRLGGIFVTHLHSDHTADLGALMVLGGLGFRARPDAVVPVVGPGRRGALPPMNPHATRDLGAIFPDAPTPGTADMVELLLRANATDLNDRRRDSVGSDPSAIFQARDIELPPGTGFDPNADPTPDMEPFEVFNDGVVRVSATLVAHAPMAPAFAFRFDTPDGAVVVSGDTGPCENLARLAAGAKVLLHEAIDLDSMRRAHAGAAPEAFEASMRHHTLAHTTPEAAGDLARRAGVALLGLHHLVPADADPACWEPAAEAFGGPVRVLRDLDVIELAGL